MELIRHVVVLDAADVGAVSTFWAAMLDGRAITGDERFHCVVDAEGQWVIGVQHAPDHVPPEWPAGAPQQVHLDLHVAEFAPAHDQAIGLGAGVLQPADDPHASEGHQVYADPAGHPFCIGWGHPDADQLRRFLAELPDEPN